ncbi:MAG: hypothetical protein MH252_00335 [Thermosynechococcaceae cyanobacterium MS004]|nr:hypothetical protein [Thermosynechococcaceae cyanobacterium MS004]
MPSVIERIGTNLRDASVIVLSNNDGCVILRSPQTQAAGLQQGWGMRQGRRSRR